ncbi:MAG: lipocalin family protein [Bacteroidota bacterium]
MKTIRLISQIALLAFFSFITSCDKDDEVSPTVLTITVTENNNPLAEASVQVYQNEEDFEKDENVLLEGKTNASGELSLSGLTVNEVYISVQKGATSNWGQTLSFTIEQNKTNPIKVNTTSTLATYLVGRTQKSWQLVDASFDGSSLFSEIDACEKDNMLVFQWPNNTGYENNGSVTCQENESSQRAFTWSFENNEADLFILYENPSQEQLISIVELTNNIIRGDILIDFEGTVLPVEFKFEVVDN